IALIWVSGCRPSLGPAPGSAVGPWLGTPHPSSAGQTSPPCRAGTCFPRECCIPQELCGLGFEECLGSTPQAHQCYLTNGPKRRKCSPRGSGRVPACLCRGSPPCHQGLGHEHPSGRPSTNCSPMPTAQWSVEDEEEATRDPCRHERDRQLQAQDVDGGSHVPEQPEHEMLLSLKPSEAPELDEDEGFGDWSQRPEQRQEHEGVQGASDSREPPRCRSPEGEQEDKPGLHACEKEDGDEVHLEELSLIKEGPDPEDTVQDNLGAAGAEEEQEEHQKCQQPRTPSPLILERTIEHSSPPLSPTTKLIDRTESLNRSIEKSNSVKKSQPDLPISKIDQWLEQYTQAIETAGRTPKLARQASIELPSMAVASTKSRWETGEVQAQSATKTPSCKDIVAGDMSKKSLWEQKGGSKTSSTIKSTPSGKRYKFVATGHGKYEKVLVEGGPAP
uniref:Lymphocyte specific protein 1 n=2 Tax=Colobus angolensis palliatus TaxID=336983 RepID=A0A2K5I493_COLAP